MPYDSLHSTISTSKTLTIVSSANHYIIRQPLYQPPTIVASTNHCIKLPSLGPLLFFCLFVSFPLSSPSRAELRTYLSALSPTHNPTGNFPVKHCPTHLLPGSSIALQHTYCPIIKQYSTGSSTPIVQPSALSQHTYCAVIKHCQSHLLSDQTLSSTPIIRPSIRLPRHLLSDYQTLHHI